MAWISVDDDLFGHHKTSRLRRLLKLETRREAASYVVALWIFTLRHAWKYADLSNYHEIEIEEACEWTGDPGVLIKALQTAGFLDGLVVHDWIVRQKKLVGDRLYREAQRLASRALGVQTDILEAWNVFAAKHSLPACTEQQAGNIPCSMAIADFHGLLTKMAKQPFLLGKGKLGWRTTLQWVLNPDNLDKINSGQYEGPGSPPVKEDDGLAAAAELDRNTREFLKRRRAQGVDV